MERRQFDPNHRNFEGPSPNFTDRKHRSSQSEDKQGQTPSTSRMNNSSLNNSAALKEPSQREQDRKHYTSNNHFQSPINRSSHFQSQRMDHARSPRRVSQDRHRHNQDYNRAYQRDSQKDYHQSQYRRDRAHQSGADYYRKDSSHQYFNDRPSYRESGHGDYRKYGSNNMNRDDRRQSSPDRKGYDRHPSRYYQDRERRDYHDSRYKSRDYQNYDRDHYYRRSPPRALPPRDYQKSTYEGTRGGRDYGYQAHRRSRDPHHHHHTHYTQQSIYSRHHYSPRRPYDHKTYERSRSREYQSSRGYHYRDDKYKHAPERYDNNRYKEEVKRHYPQRSGEYVKGPRSSQLQRRSQSERQKSRRDQSNQQKNRSEEYDSESQDGSGGDSGSSDGDADRSKDAGHFKFKIGFNLGKYRIDSHLGDGTFGRALKCLNIVENKHYAVKVIRAVKRYNESAKTEADILTDIGQKGGCDNGIVHLKEYFNYADKDGDHMCLVFETLGKSLYDFIKINKYKGYSLTQIQSITRQCFQALDFLHSIGLTHTDLKPENILLKNDAFEKVRNKGAWPMQVIKKKDIYGPSRCDDDGSDEEGSDPKKVKEEVWYRPVNDEVKLIDFGGATYDDEHHTAIINTRQYRAPEVILGCQQWNTQSDIWSMACIVAELYTGEMFYSTHENIEHLALMEKVCGVFPKHMAENSQQPYKDCFRLSSSEEFIKKEGMRLNWPRVAKKRENIRNFDEMLTLDDLFHHQQASHDHMLLKDFLAYMFILDPSKRPTASQCLRHPFLTTLFVDETAEDDAKQMSIERSAEGSKSTEKTLASTLSASRGPQTDSYLPPQAQYTSDLTQ